MSNLLKINQESFICCGASTLYDFYDNPYSKNSIKLLTIFKTYKTFLSLIITCPQAFYIWEGEEDKDGVRPYTDWMTILQETGFVIANVFSNKGVGNVLIHMVRVGSKETPSSEWEKSFSAQQQYSKNQHEAALKARAAQKAMLENKPQVNNSDNFKPATHVNFVSLNSSGSILWGSS